MRSGGSFIKESNGSLKKVEGTEDHPQGNRPRDANGKAIDAPEPVITEAVIAEAPKAKPGKNKE